MNPKTGVEEPRTCQGVAMRSLITQIIQIKKEERNFDRPTW